MRHFRRAGFMNIKLPYFNKGMKNIFPCVRSAELYDVFLHILYIFTVYMNFTQIRRMIPFLTLQYMVHWICVTVSHRYKKKAHKIIFKPQSLVFRHNSRKYN
jgi:hypothetical protein